MALSVENNLHLAGLDERVDTASAEALEHAAEHVLEVAKRRAPYLVDVQRANREEKPGTLRESGYVRRVDDQNVAVGFSDFAATWQHERLDYHHEVGEAKFLESSLASEEREVMDILARDIGDAV